MKPRPRLPRRAAAFAGRWLAVDDIDVPHASLAARGATVPRPPQDRGVCRAFAIRDRVGNTNPLRRRADGSLGPTPASPANS